MQEGRGEDVEQAVYSRRLVLYTKEMDSTIPFESSDSFVFLQP